MLVVCNGSPKSGSTWLVQIVRSTGAFNRIPEAWQAEGWRTPSIDDKHLKRLPNIKVLAERNLYCKQHWDNPLSVIAAQSPNILFLNVVRDLRDMMVSRYFHDVREKTFAGSIEDYFRTGTAQKSLREYIGYHRVWHGTAGAGLCHLSSYEALSTDFESSATALLQAIGVWTPEEIGPLVAHAEEKTRFDKKAKTGAGEFFRKGTVGDFENHLSAEMLDQISQVAAEENYAAIKANMAEDFPDIAEAILATDVSR